MSNSLTVKTINGVKWSTASTVTNSLMQIGYTAIMARLLTPSAFGLVALGNVLLRFGGYFANMGLIQSLIQKKELATEEIRAGFTSSIFLGCFFTVLIISVAPLGEYFFHNPDLVPILRVMAFSFLISGFANTSISLLRRNIRFKELATAEIISYIISYVFIGVGLAYFDYGVWSLVFASLSQSLIYGVLSYLYVRHNVYFIFKWAPYKSLFSYGSRVSMVSFLEFIGSNMDTLLIGRLLGSGLLGIYNRAYMLVSLPVQYFTLSISKVLFPAFSKIQGDKPRLGKVYKSAILIVAYIVFPACVGIAACSKNIVWVLLGEKWLQAVPIVQILSFAIPFSLIAHFGGIICDATANLNIKAILQASYVVFIAALFYSLKTFGLVGFAFVILIGLFLRNLAYVFVVKRIIQIPFKEILGSYVPGLVSSVIVGIVLSISTYFFDMLQLPHYVVLINQVILGAAMLLLLLFAAPNKKIRFEIAEKLHNSSMNMNKNGLKGKIINKSINFLEGIK